MAKNNSTKNINIVSNYEHEHTVYTTKCADVGAVLRVLEENMSEEIKALPGR